MMSSTDIDYLVTDFYNTISFKTNRRPEYEELIRLFDSNAVLINNSFAKPLRFTPQEFVDGLQSQVADGTMKQFMQREIYSKTDVFGKVAQRVSVYEYSFAEVIPERIPRGINFVQCIYLEDRWVIAAMAWNDENENYIIPGEYLIK